MKRDEFNHTALYYAIKQYMHYTDSDINKNGSINFCAEFLECIDDVLKNYQDAHKIKTNILDYCGAGNDWEYCNALAVAIDFADNKLFNVLLNHFPEKHALTVENLLTLKCQATKNVKEKSSIEFSVRSRIRAITKPMKEINGIKTKEMEKIKLKVTRHNGHIIK
eukprot:172936_1